MVFVIISVCSFYVTKEMFWISSKQSTKRTGEHMQSVIPCFLLIFFFILLMTSVSLEIQLLRSSIFPLISCIFFSCSTIFDVLVRLLMLFWFGSASNSAASVFLSIVFILVLNSWNLAFIFCIIFFPLFSMSLVRKFVRSSDIYFMFISLAAMPDNCYVIFELYWVKCSKDKKWVAT